MDPKTNTSSPSSIHPQQHQQQQPLSNRHGQGTLASILKQAPPPFPEVHHAPIIGMPSLPTSVSSASPTVSSSSVSYSPLSSFNPMSSLETTNDSGDSNNNDSGDSNNNNSNDASIASPSKDRSTYPTPSPSDPFNGTFSPVEPTHTQLRRVSLNTSTENPSPHQDLYKAEHHRLAPPNDSLATATSSAVPSARIIAAAIIPSSVPLTPTQRMPFVSGSGVFQRPLLSTFPAAGPRSSIPIRGDTEYTIPSTPVHRQTPSRAGAVFSKSAPFPAPPPIHPMATQHQQHRDEIMHNNPYRAPSCTNSCAFIPPKVPGYDFKQGSQAGNMGLMIGKRISDGMPVSGILHQSRLLLQHEHRILKRLQIMNGRYDPSGPLPPQFMAPSVAESGVSTGAEEAGAKASVEAGAEEAGTADVEMENKKTDDKHERAKSGCHRTPGNKRTIYETGLVEDEKYFNRIVEDFIDLDQGHMSILILRRLGPNLLSRYHHRFTGLDETDGHQSPEMHEAREMGSPFPDVYTFLVFCLKAACVLEALQRANLAHLALCPTSFHWSPPDSEVTAPGPENAAKDQEQAQRMRHLNPSSLYHDPDLTVRSSGDPFGQLQESLHPGSPNWNSASQQQNSSPVWDVNRTKLRLFDFTHSKILSHERARAPNNIFEWQVPGYLEYHLQYLAPEQTGRAETWMDHRTDIYGLGATLFSLLTNQFPNQGIDSVQILQGVLSRPLPSLLAFRPDIPLIIDGILQKMTQKQPSQRYQSAFGFKQDILRCLNELHRHGTIEPFPLGKHDISFQFVLPNAVFGRHVEQQMISAAISQAASAYQNSLNNDVSDSFSEDQEEVASRMAALNDSDHYVFEDDIVSLQSHTNTKIPLSSKTLLRTPKPFNAGKSVHRGSETTDPIVRAIFVSGPSGVGKTILIRGMAAVARNSGLFAGGGFEAEGSEPYSAILSCIRSVLQQLLTQHTDALASLVVAMRTAFEPNSGIGIICDLVPELKYFFSVSEMPESKDVPLTHSVARFHALILKLIRVISTHFFMTWLIDDIHYADDNSIALLATLVNVNKRLPMVLIMTHRDTVDCLIKVKQILGGSNVLGNNHTGSYGSLGGIHHDSLVDEISNTHASASAQPSMSKTTAIRATGLPLAVRGGGGVRFIRLQNPTMETIQGFLGVLLHRDKAECAPLAKVLYQKSWLTIRQLVLELYRNQTIYFNCRNRVWEWEECQETLAQVVRRLTGEEYAFLENRFRALDCDTKKTLVCAAICGSVFTVRDLQHLASTAYVWPGNVENGQNQPASSSEQQKPATPLEQEKPASPPEQQKPMTVPADSNKGCSAMAGLQSALREGILVYTSSPESLRFNHSIMRKVALNLLEATDEKERLHYEMVKIMIRTPGQELRTASHVLQCLQLIKKKATSSTQNEGPKPYWIPAVEKDDEPHRELDIQALRSILSRAGEKSQKSGAQDMAMAFWNAALSLLPENCWDPPAEGEDNSNAESGSADVDMESTKDSSHTVYKKTPLYQEAFKMHLQCIEAERWRERFDEAMKMCDMVLSKIVDPVDRARVYQHQIEMSVWAYSQTAQATRIAIQCLQELGMPKDMTFEPTQDEIRELYDRTHQMMLSHMEELQAENPKTCHDRRIMMMMEVLSISNASLYYCNIPFLAVGVAYSIKLVCDYGITAHAGRAMASFALTHSTWHGCLENAYELGLLGCRVSKDNHHVKFLFHMTVQQWGDHVANSIPALEETLTAADMTCDRLFHTAGMIHVAVMRILLGRVHLRDCMASAIDLITKHIEFGPKSHGVEVMYGIAQLIKCLRGQTHASNPETIFDDNEYAESTMHSRREKALVMVHNNSTYTMLKIVAAFVFGHYAFINEVTDSWHDDPKSMMNFEGSWIAHSIFTVVGLTQVNLLRTEQDPEVRKKLSRRLSVIRDRMEQRAKQFPTNHAAMFHLLEAEIADQEPDESKKDLKKVLLLYEKAIAIATEGNFPLHQTFSYELAAKCHLRHGLITSARCLLANSCKGYQEWGAKGKVQWLYKTYPEVFGSPADIENAIPSRGLFYRPNDIECHPAGHPPGPSGTVGSNVSSAVTGSATSGIITSPWLSGSPKTIYSPSGYGNDAVSAAAAAIAKSCMATNIQSGSVSSASSTSGPLYSLQSNWVASPGTPESDNVDLDVLDFSSVIEAMQVIASEIDLDLLLVKSLGVLNQSVGAKRCCVIIYKDQELLLAASQGDLGRCEPVNPPMEIGKCSDLFHGVINYVVNTSAPCLLTNAKDDPRFCADEYLKQRTDVKTVLCAPILHKATLVGVLYMEEFPERAFANMRILVMNLLVQQLGISITNALLYQSVLQSETKLNGLLENMPCGIALWDATADVCQYINSSWKDMTGFSIQEILDSGWGILVHEDEVAIYYEHWHERVLAGVPCQWESRYKLKDGSYRWAIVRMLPIMSPTDNKVIQWLTVTIDIDDQRRAVQLKSNFLANMSHELRTPFSGILGMLSLLRDSSGLSHEQFEFVDMAKASCEMLIRIVDDLLNFSKLEADKVTLEYIPLVFEEIIGDVCDLLVPLASRKGLELIILIDDTLPLLLIGDPDRVKQILMNLVGNAIKFSSTGNVVIEFWHEINKRETLTRAAKNNWSSQNLLKMHSNKGGGTNSGMTNTEDSTTSSLAKKDELDDSKLGDEVVLHCSVKDQGIGLSPEEQKMLFVSFQQTDNGTTRKYGGTGLGLSICAQLIAHMHGNIKVDSEKGQGATFTFTAKLRTETAYDTEQSPAETARIMECGRILNERLDAIKGRRMMILSPNRMLREQIKRILKGVVCLEFDDVKSALESGAIRMTELCSSDGSEINMDVDARDQHASMDGGAMEQQDHTIQGEDNAPRPEDMLRFDFILVDHVLDSAELDRIYPLPIVAFILLLAPTTETLRWILPPAVKKPQEPEEPPESGQIDIGGRGRIFKSSDIDFARQELRGQVQRVSHEASAQQNNAALASISGGAAAAAATAKYQRAEHKGVSLQGRKPSELFKRRRSRRHITVTRPMPSSSSCLDASVKNGTCDDGENSTHQDCQGRKPQRMETTTFQACRLIKPVRRMKLLQIAYNAVVQHLKYQAGDMDETDIVDLDSSGVQSALSGEDEDMTPRSSMSPTSLPSITADASAISATSMKRQREHESPDSGCDQVYQRRPFKSSRSSLPSKVSSTSSSGSDETASRPLGRNGTAAGAQAGNMPKRARNNDALTVLLSSEERQSCRGKNVLVAEDDFVSQKILEKQLSKLGMNVMIANNGQEAVNQWLSAGQGHYTIAIFDHHMPIMDGLAATKKLRALEAEMAHDQTEEGKAPIRIPIVGLSADIQQTTKESCIKAGMDEYMTKPLLTKGLALLIQRYCCN